MCVCLCWLVHYNRATIRRRRPSEHDVHTREKNSDKIDKRQRRSSRIETHMHYCTVIRILVSLYIW